MDHIFDAGPGFSGAGFGAALAALLFVMPAARAGCSHPTLRRLQRSVDPCQQFYPIFNKVNITSIRKFRKLFF
jgi:hypothetical protein